MFERVRTLGRRELLVESARCRSRKRVHSDDLFRMQHSMIDGDAYLVVSPLPPPCRDPCQARGHYVDVNQFLLGTQNPLVPDLVVELVRMWQG